MALLLALSVSGVVMQAPQTSPEPAQTVTGRVVETGSLTPIAGACVTLTPITNTPPSPTLGRTAYSDQYGRYVFVGVEPGRYRVRAERAGYTSTRDLAQPVEVAVGERPVAADLPLDVGAVITGRVLDEANQAVANARISAFQVNPTAGGAAGVLTLVRSMASTQTNDLGEFRLFGLVPTAYYIQASPPTSVDGGVESSPGKILASTFYNGTTDVLTAQAIAVAAGQTFTEVVIHIVTVPAFEVSGVVVDETGRPVVDAHVRLSRDEQRVAWPALEVHGGQSGAAGRFKIRGITNGTYKLVPVQARLRLGV